MKPGSSGSRAPPQEDLFGRPPAGSKDRTPVVLRLDCISSASTEKALFLREPWKGGKAGHAARSEVRVVEGRPGFWRMPTWLARERGWL